MKVGLLFSGGLDSTLTYLYLINTKKIKPKDIICYYFPCSKYYEQEEESIFKLSKYLNIESLNVSYDLEYLESHEQKNSFIPFRNLLFFINAALALYGKVDTIFIGGMADDRVSDNNKMFYVDLNNFMHSAYPEINIRYYSPVIHLSKIELLKMCKDRNWVDDIEKLMSLTFSCYNPDSNNNECLSCKACFRKNVALNSIGIYRDFKNDYIIDEYKEDSINNMHIKRYEATMDYIDRRNSNG